MRHLHPYHLTQPTMPKATPTSPTPRCRPEVFLLAASLIDAYEHCFACNALYEATGAPGGWSMEEDLAGNPIWHAHRDAVPEVQLFTRLFKPKEEDEWTDRSCGGDWDGDRSAWYECRVTGAEHTSSRSARILALCLAAHLVAEGEAS